MGVALREELPNNRRDAVNTRPAKPRLYEAIYRLEGCAEWREPDRSTWLYIAPCAERYFV